MTLLQQTLQRIDLKLLGVTVLGVPGKVEQSKDIANLLINGMKELGLGDARRTGKTPPPAPAPKPESQPAPVNEPTTAEKTAKIISLEKDQKRASDAYDNAKKRLEEKKSAVSDAEKQFAELNLTNGAEKDLIETNKKLTEARKEEKIATDAAKTALDAKIDAETKLKKARGNKPVAPAAESAKPETANLSADQIAALKNDPDKDKSAEVKPETAKLKPSVKNEYYDWLKEFQAKFGTKNADKKLSMAFEPSPGEKFADDAAIQKSTATAAKKQLDSLNEVNGNWQELTDTTNKLIAAHDEQAKIDDNTTAVQKLTVTAAKQQLDLLNDTNGSWADLTGANENLTTSFNKQANINDNTAIQQLTTAAEKQLATMNESTASQKDITDANKKLVEARKEQANISDAAAIKKLVVTAAEKQLTTMNETTGSLKDVTDANKKLVEARKEQANISDAAAIQKLVVTAIEKQLASLKESTGNLKELTGADKNLIEARKEQANIGDITAIQKLVVTAIEKQLASLRESSSSWADLTGANKNLTTSFNEQANIGDITAIQKLVVNAAKKQLATMNESTASQKDVTGANKNLTTSFNEQANIGDITAIQKLVVNAAEKQLASLTETTGSWADLTGANKNLTTSFNEQANIGDITAIQKLIVTAAEKQLASLTETTGSLKDVTSANEKLIASRNKQETVNDNDAIQKINKAKLVVTAAEKQLASLTEATGSLKELTDANENLVAARNNQVLAEKELEKTLKDRVEAENQLTADQKKVKINNLQPEVLVGSKVSYENLIQEQKTAINHLLESIGKLPAMGQTSDDVRGKVEWEKQLKNDINTQTQLFDAINNQVKLDREQKNKTNKNSNESVAPNDRRMNDAAALQADQMAALGPNNKNSSGASDLTIDSDVATINSKGMNIKLDNSADVARMLAETMATKTDIEKKYQPGAANSFENSFKDLKDGLSNQNNTNEMLLAAIQELIRVQKTGVDWQQKTYQATA
jgi:hypothetical protein